MQQSSDFQLKPFDDYLFDTLQDKERAIGFLNAALEEDDQIFLQALKDLATAWGMERLTQETGLSQSAFQHLLSEDTTPSLHHVRQILSAFGLRFSIIREDEVAEGHA